MLRFPPITRLVFLAFLAAGCLRGADLPPLVFPSGVGVNIHFARSHEKDLDMIAAAGFKFVRMDFLWNEIEQKKGVYDWTAYDELTNNLEKRKIRPIYILDFSNPLYEETVVARNPITGKDQPDTASPRSSGSIAAFANWAAAAAKHFQGHKVIWEIWNEPNLTFWKPKPDVKQYAALALATCRAVRTADPQATIIAPGAGEIPWPFLESLFASGVLEYLDAVSVHPYRDYADGPETAGADYLRLRGLIERYAPPSKKFLPIISGEWGYPTHTKGVSLEIQAAFIARMQLANLLNHVPISIWYDWANDSDDPTNNESNFGTVGADLTPKPGYIALQTLTQQLSGFRIAHRLHTAADDDFVLLLVNATGDQKLVGWTVAGPHTISIDAGVSAAHVSAVDGQGRPVQIKEAGGSCLEINLQTAPQYITLKEQIHTLAASAAWNLAAPMPVWITPNDETGIKIPITVKNPFSDSLRVKLTLETADNTASTGFDLPAGKTVTKTLHFTTTRRSPAKIDAVLKVQMFEKSGTLILENTEAQPFLLANSLKLLLTAQEDGPALVIKNPSRSSFTGDVMINGVRVPVKLDRNMPEFVAHASPPADFSTITASLVGPNDVRVSETLTGRFQSLSPIVPKAHLDGDAKVSGSADVVETDAPGKENKPFARAFRLDYSFGDGWRFVRCETGTANQSRFRGRPKELGMWVYGDDSGASLRALLVDRSGQHFQPGLGVDFSGWQWVTFDLTKLNRTYHWGGANDGQVHGELALDAFIVEKDDHKKASGTICFAGPALVY